MKDNHIKKIFERADIQQICEFLVSGLDLDELDKHTYGERLEEGSLRIVNRLKKMSKDEEEFSDMYEDFSDATVAYTNVCLEIGMKTGARLLYQLLHEDE